jgi:hypothetical protein
MWRVLLLVGGPAVLIVFAVLTLRSLEGKRGERIGPLGYVVHTFIAWFVIVFSVFYAVMSLIAMIRGS